MMVPTARSVLVLATVVQMGNATVMPDFTLAGTSALGAIQDAHSAQVP